MPVWHQIFSELKLAPRILLCLRNPAQIARSLNARDGLDPEIGEYRWLVYMIDFFRYISNFEFCTLEYEGWFNDPSANLEKLRKFLDLHWKQSEADLALVLSGIIDPALRHDDAEHREANQPLVRMLYKLASRIGQDGARDQIAYIVSQFVGFQQLQRPFLRAFEEVAKVAAKYPEIEEEAVALRAAVGERDQAVGAADGRAAAVEERLAEAVAEIEGQRTQIAELARERDEASGVKATLAERETVIADVSRRADGLLAALQAAQAEAAAREAALRRAEQEAHERGAAAAAIQAEVGALREILARTEHDLQERGAAAAAIQAEVGALREILARAEHDLQERGAAAAAIQAEVGALREILARAEHDLRERGAAGAALQAEIVALKSTLTAARQVGKAAIAALQIGGSAPTKRDVQRGWRQAVMRLFGARTSI